MLPPWLKKRVSAEDIALTRRHISNKCLHTVCEKASCPNMCECYAKKTATFLLLGDHCTRACPFCNISCTVRPAPPDENEPEHIVEAVVSLSLQHVVLTMVTRDDLQDGGASHMARTVSLLRKAVPKSTIEVLTSDFQGDHASLQCMVDSDIDIFNHNIETVARLTPRVRHRATYGRSLDVLQSAHRMKPSIKTKSGLMVGLGEKPSEVHTALQDLYEVGVSIVTIGQYLQPSSTCLEVYEYVHPEQFQAYRDYGLSLGIQHLFAGPFVRSSYHADRFI